MLFKLLGAPLALPASGLKFVLQQIADLADAELNDEAVVHEQLLLLQVQLEEGDIDEDEYLEREAELMQRLREIRAYREQKAREQRARLGAPAAAGPTRPDGAVVEITTDLPLPSSPAPSPPESAASAPRRES